VLININLRKTGFVFDNNQLVYLKNIMSPLSTRSGQRPQQGLAAG